MANRSGPHRSVINHRSFPGFHARDAMSMALDDQPQRPKSASHDTATNHGDSDHHNVSVQDINKFENNWEDLDAEFETKEDTWESNVMKMETLRTDHSEMATENANNTLLSDTQKNDQDLWDPTEDAWEIEKPKEVDREHEKPEEVDWGYQGIRTTLQHPKSERSETYKLSEEKVPLHQGRNVIAFTFPFSLCLCIKVEILMILSFSLCLFIGWYILWFLSLLVIAFTFPFSLCLCIKVVQEYERAVIFRLGRLVKGGAKGPGLFFIIPCIDSYTKVDIRTVSFDVPPQEVLTKDSVTVAVDAVVYYRVQNATMSITNVEDANRSTRLLAATTLRNVLGTKNLSEILSERESISHVMQSSLDDATDPWGVKVERVEVKDVRLPVQLQRAMAAEAEAAREARAKVIAAEGEQKASRALKEAADVISESPAAIQLRYLQTLNTISAEKNSTIIFPLPIDLVQSILGRQGSSL
ncbi:band 7 protein AGAP004871-like [Ylistrum balloti]|uniref:band 7 protein AGAP004871-like n=1 Tax=Ylistrum balloti TaxID=509963 RepID=UPI00290595F2|nr:band 7 protein AGAP004871-like [Ylistrum balloti]